MSRELQNQNSPVIKHEDSPNSARAKITVVSLV